MVAYLEVDESSKAQRSPHRSRSRYIVGEFPFRVPTVKPPIDKPSPKLGIGEPLMPAGLCCKPAKTHILNTHWLVVASGAFL